VLEAAPDRDGPHDGHRPTEGRPRTCQEVVDCRRQGLTLDEGRWSFGPPALEKGARPDRGPGPEILQRLFAARFVGRPPLESCAAPPPTRIWAFLANENRRDPRSCSPTSPPPSSTPKRGFPLRAARASQGRAGRAHRFDGGRCSPDSEGGFSPRHAEGQDSTRSSPTSTRRLPGRRPKSLAAISKRCRTAGVEGRKRCWTFSRRTNPRAANQIAR